MNIRVENLHKSFFLEHKVEIKALRGIDLNINSGEIVAIKGPSGAGKSTLLHILGLMDRPSTGNIMLNHKDFSKLNDNVAADTRRNKIGFIFQMHYLLPEFNVLENVLIPVWEKRREIEQKVHSIIKQIGLEGRMNHLPAELSGGEQQRVALARALVNEPELLLADEPTGNLDRETGEKIEELIFSECRKRKITLILVTHNSDLAKKCDRVIEIRDGLLV
ncbi:MAG: ABC transporter ATP-binding protein [Endomicrobiales bacterium]|nr:ABC transporter ATP-binding protein [Endomicrobiales bacterium]